VRFLVSFGIVFPIAYAIETKATLYDGSFHTVDSNELSFKIAASMALKEGVHQAKPVLLEPIMAIEVRVPEQYMGDVNRDLNTRRGRLLGLDTAGNGMQVVNAHVPQAELFSYATELRSLTHGRGTFTAALDHYEEVPSHLAQKIIDESIKQVSSLRGRLGAFQKFTIGSTINSLGVAFENAAARYFLAAAPSLAEIVMLGKVWWHAAHDMERGRPRWDLVILDAPATGHGLTFLTVPEVFLRLVTEGLQAACATEAAGQACNATGE